MRTIIAVLLHIFLSSAYADSPKKWNPNQITRYLVNTPVDWMTFGSQRASDALTQKTGYKIEVSYNNIIDKIIISTNLTKEDVKFESKELAQKFCHDLVHKIRKAVNLNDDGNPGTPYNESQLHLYFSPWGFENIKMPEKFGSNLDLLVLIQTRHTFYMGDTNEMKTCESPLRNGNIEFKDF